MSDNKQNAIIQQERINNFNQGLNQGYIQQFQDSSKKSNGEDSNQKLQNNNNQQQPKRRCNCKQSRCIKLYCECYAYGAYCDGCHCINCLNNANAEGYRQNAIANTLVRNPVAFQPKITVNDTKTQDISSLGKHNKGCACKRSGCMKKYCECFQAGVPCSENCKCTLCQNRVNTQGNSQGRFNFLGGNFIGDDNQKREILKMLVLVGDKKKIDQFIGKQSNFGEQNFQIQDMIQDQSKKLLDIFCASPEELVKNEENVTFLLSMHDQLVADYQTPQKSKFEQVQQQQLPKQNNNQFVQFQKKEQSQKEKINDKNNVQLDYQSEQEQMSQEESDVQQQQEDQKNKEQNNKNDNFNIKLENNASSNSGLNNQQPQIKNFNLLNNTNIHISQEINEPIYNNQSNPNNSIVNTLNNNLQAKRSFTKHINSSDQKINLNQMQSQQTNISQNLSFSNPLGQIINLNVSTSIKEQQDDLEENLTCPEEIEEDQNKQVQQQQKIIDNQNQLLLGEQGINKELQVSLFVFKKKLILNKFIEELRKIESQVGNQIIKKEHENSEQESIQNEEQEQQEFEEIQQQQPNEIEIQQQIQNIQFLKQIQLNQQNEKQINQEKIYSNDNQIEIEEEISEINENLNLKDLNQIQNQNQNQQNQNQQQQFKSLQTSNILINQENIQIEQNQEQEQKQQFIQKNDDIQVEDQN